MKKYIVKNCPCFNEGHPELRFSGECLDLTQAENDCCAEVTGCLIKQVIEKCKERIQHCEDCREYTCEDCRYDTNGFVGIILQLFEIEECNDEVWI